MNQRVYPSQKSKIIEAAVQLILEKGPNSIKTDAVIEASGLSKGGFFYHFKTMDDLFYELGKKSWVDFFNMIELEAAKDPDPVGRFCRAYIKVSLGMVTIKKQEATLHQIFLSVITNNQNLILRLRNENEEIQKFFSLMAVNDALPEEKVQLICMAADGYWFNEIIGLSPMKKKDKIVFYDYLVSLTRII